MRNSCKIISVVLALIIILGISPAAYAEEVIDATITYMDIIPPVNSESSEEIQLYSCSPTHLYPFVYTGKAPFMWLDVDTSDCIVGQLYVYNKTTNSVVSIGNNTVLSHAETKEHLFYVTDDLDVYMTDYQGSSHIPLYTAEEGEITDLGTFGSVLYFIENGNQVKILDVSSRRILSTFAQDDVFRVDMFAPNQVIIRNSIGDPSYYNFTTKQFVELNNEYEVNYIMAPYTAISISENADASILGATPTSRGAVENNISFPLPEYQANIGNGFTYPTPISYFTEGGYYRRYAGSGRCDGFAKFAHDRFLHIEDVNRNTPSWMNSNGTSTMDVTNTDYRWNSSTAVREYFEGLTQGAFIRYGKDNDTELDDEGAHSIVFDGINGNMNGAWVYECNQDGNNGVFYQNYYYTSIYDNYQFVAIRVNHTFTQRNVYQSEQKHKVNCNFCDGYLIQNHSSAQERNLSSLTQHIVSYDCCDGTVTKNHTASAQYTYYTPTSHKVTFSCCSGYVTRSHTFTTGADPYCTGCGYYKNSLSTAAIPTEPVSE